ncbi:hypothetical protein AMK16_03520 [Streptomyces sp. CB00455]|nr:hypothetical protein AMK16_03520 [Streptomyces sp. CB00455]
MFHGRTRAVRRDLSQLVCALAGLGLGLPAPLITGGPQVNAGRVVSLLFTLGFGVISLVSIIYSMLFLVVQFSASTFTPRLGLFRDEPIVWRTFAFTVGVFVFTITAGLTIGTRGTVSVLVPCAAMILALVALALMRTLQMRAFSSIQLAHSLTAIVTRAHRLFDALYVRPYDPGRAPAAPAPQTPAPSAAVVTVRWSGPSAVLQQIDARSLIRTAQEHDCTLAFRAAPGTTLWQGRPLVDVTGGPMPDTALRDTMVTGVERTFDQDPELPLRLLADIALRALSPAVNDPATAVESMDRMEDLLGRLAGRDLEVGRFTDGTGRTRLTVPLPDWDRYVRTALDELLFAAAGSPMALRRLRTLLARLAEQSPPGRRAVLEERLHWADGAGNAAYPLVWAASEGR